MTMIMHIISSSTQKDVSGSIQPNETLTRMHDTKSSINHQYNIIDADKIIIKNNRRNNISYQGIKAVIILYRFNFHVKRI